MSTQRDTRSLLLRPFTYPSHTEMGFDNPPKTSSLSTILDYLSNVDKNKGIKYLFESECLDIIESLLSMQKIERKDIVELKESLYKIAFTLNNEKMVYFLYNVTRYMNKDIFRLIVEREMMSILPLFSRDEIKSLASGMPLMNYALSTDKLSVVKYFHEILREDIQELAVTVIAKRKAEIIEYLLKKGYNKPALMSKFYEEKDTTMFTLCLEYKIEPSDNLMRKILNSDDHNTLSYLLKNCSESRTIKTLGTVINFINAPKCVREYNDFRAELINVTTYDIFFYLKKY
jgi:hypothetical protein